jgi:hypothetical protein
MAAFMQFESTALELSGFMRAGARKVRVGIGRDAGGVSLVSWACYLLAACLWFVYGAQKRV